MFGPPGNHNFPSRRNFYAEDLMSLNTLKPDDHPIQARQIDRGFVNSLKTDDIEGAQPRGQMTRSSRGLPPRSNQPSPIQPGVQNRNY